jgi:hypothetical protein
MLRKTRTFQMITGGTAVGVGLGLLAIITSQVMIYTGRGLSANGRFLTTAGLILLVLALSAGLAAYHIFNQRWQARQQLINQNLAQEGITIALAPRSATLTDPKDIGLWRRLAVMLNRAGDYPDRHITWEVIGSRDRLVVLMRIPQEWLRGLAGEINREFPDTEISILPGDPQALQPNQINSYLDPLAEAQLQGEQLFWQCLRLGADTAYPLFAGETRIDQMTALLSAASNVNPKAHVGYQFLIRRALPNTGQRWTKTAQSLLPKAKPGQPAAKIPPETKRLMEAIEERARQPAFEVDIRVWASSADPQVASGELQRIAQALIAETVTSGPFNQIVPGPQGTDPTAVITRSFLDAGAELTAAELGNFLHLPGKKGAEPYPKLMTASAKKLPPPPSLVVDEAEAAARRVLGHFYHATGDVDIVGQPFAETRKHQLTIGPTGSGKSVSLINSVIADRVLHDAGVMIIEPSGDIPVDLVNALPADYLDDVVLLNPRDFQPFALNMCAIGMELGLAAAVQNAVGAIRLAMGANWATAVRMQQLIINGLYVIMDVLNRPGEEGASMVALGRFLQNGAYRERLVERTSLEATGAKNFWASDFAGWSEKEQKESVSVAMRRLSGWIGNPQIRRTLGLPFSTIDLAALLGGPLGEEGPPPRLILLPLHPRMGKDTKSLIGALLVNTFVSVMLLRDAIPRHQRRTAALHIDEFKNFMNTSGSEDIEILLAECRKYGAAASLYTQGQRQLKPDILVETDINTLTKVFYGLSDQKEARLAAGQMAGAVDVYDLMNVPPYHAYLKVGHNAPTLIKMLPPAQDQTPSSPLQKSFSRRPPAAWKPLVKEVAPFSRFYAHDDSEGMATPASLSELTAPDLLRWAYRQQQSDPDTLVRQLAALPAEDFTALRETRRQFDRWRAAELSANPGLIPDRLQRVAWRSRWLYGIPGWESDALYLRITNEGQAGPGEETAVEEDNFDYEAW